MKTANMKVIWDLDKQIEDTKKRYEKDCSCFITLYHDKETDSIWMCVLTLDCRVWDDIQVAKKCNKDTICVGIMRWFKEHGNEVKGG